MALADIIRKGVALARKITDNGEITVPVLHEAWTGDGNYGEPTYAAAATLMAIVAWKQKTVPTMAGTTTVSRAYIAFLFPVVIDEKDKLTLPDGTTGPIIDMEGFIDRATGIGYTTEVWLG